MKQSAIRYLKTLFIICMLSTIVYIKPVIAHAAVMNFTVNNNEPAIASIYVGDTGTITPNLSFIEDQTALQYYTYSFDSNNTNILTVDNNGLYTAINPGTVTVNVYVYSGDYYYSYPIFTSSIQFTIGIDMTNVTLSTDTVVAYMYPEYYNKSKPYYSSPEANILINSDYVFNEYDYSDYDDYNDDYNYTNNTESSNTSFTYTCSNPMLGIEANISNNTIYIQQSTNTTGSGIITFNLYGKLFYVNYQCSKLDISKQSCLLVKGKKEQLTVTGYIGTIEWSSSNPSIATVDRNGKVKGKKIGNVIIKAKVGDHYLGCAVSVTKAKLKKVAERATYIGTHWKYSQPKRTQKGYYDCSALVWKAYKEKARLTFGSPYYPGVALTEAQWCRSHNKMIKGGMTYKKITKMQVNPGDLLFKSSDMKKKYADIYHVEMFTGYFCNSVNSDGSANFSPLWAARDSYYSFEEGSLLGRPMK